MDIVRSDVMLLLSALFAIIVWSGVSHRLERWHVSAPIFMIGVGIGVGFFVGDDLASRLNTDEAERIVELILAMLLFLDATEVRGGFFAGERGTVLRLLGIAFPLSLALAFVLGFPLLDASAWPVLLAVACVVMPIDFAPAVTLLRLRNVRRGVRHALAVESGYNDGIVSPLFALAILLLAGETGSGDATAAPVLPIAVIAIVVAVLVGVGIGTLSAIFVRLGAARGWASKTGPRLTMVIVPFLAFEVASHLQGNGFVAAFLAGIAYRLARAGRRGAHADVPHSELSSAEDVGALLSMVMWVVFGAVTVLALDTRPAWNWILYGVLALTLVRVVPVWLATLGSALSWRERTVLGLYGPRGTSSIVFGLLAYNGMREDDGNMTLVITAVVVALSVGFHGLLLPGISARRTTLTEAVGSQSP